MFCILCCYKNFVRLSHRRVLFLFRLSSSRSLSHRQEGCKSTISDLIFKTLCEMLPKVFTKSIVLIIIGLILTFKIKTKLNEIYSNVFFNCHYTEFL